jgi:hypothetical protein
MIHLLVEEEQVVMAMKGLCPDAQLPTRKKVGDSLIENRFASTTACLATDR